MRFELFNLYYKSEFLPTFLTTRNKKAKENIRNKGTFPSS